MDKIKCRVELVQLMNKHENMLLVLIEKCNWELVDDTCSQTILWLV